MFIFISFPFVLNKYQENEHVYWTSLLTCLKKALLSNLMLMAVSLFSRDISHFNIVWHSSLVFSNYCESVAIIVLDWEVEIFWV